MIRLIARKMSSTLLLTLTNNLCTELSSEKLIDKFITNHAKRACDFFILHQYSWGFGVLGL